MKSITIDKFEYLHWMDEVLLDNEEFWSMCILRGIRPIITIED